jgi:hypothetical protein
MVTDFCITRFRHNQQAIAQAYFSLFGKNPRLEINRRKQVAMSQQHLRLAYKQKTFILEGKVEASQDACLGFSIEIHQGIAAYQQIEMTDGSILNQVIATKNHASAQIAAEGIGGFR